MARGIVLLYHRIATLRSDPWALSVTPGHFLEHLQVLGALGVPTTLSDLCASARSNQCRDRSIAVTFDDGYLDNLTVAVPLLERHGIPATMFITTGAIGRTHPFWWDVLDQAILQTPDLPTTLQLTVGGAEYRWQSDQDSGIAAFELAPRWRAWGQPDPTDRHRLFRELYAALYPLTDGDRQAAAKALLAWAGIAVNPNGPGPTIPEEGLSDLARRPLIEVGAHSVTHSLLAAATRSTQRFEIEWSKEFLERRLGHAVQSFAYPFGKRGDFADTTVALVRQAGYSCACANFPGAVNGNSDLYQLPRHYVFDCDGDEFRRQLTGWLSG